MNTDKDHQKRGTIVVLTDEYVDYPKLVIDSLAAVLNKSGYGLLCIAGRGLSQSQDTDCATVCNAIYSLADADKIKGLISISGSIGHNIPIAALEQFLAQFNIPKISLNATTAGVPSVVLDDLAGMRQLVRHLLEDETRQHIAYIRGYPNDPYSRRREQIFREIMIENHRDIDESLFVLGNYDKFETFSVVTELLDKDKRIDAIVAANDLMALSAARAISTMGLRIPQDIAVTGYDDTREATQNSPALTTVRQPIDVIATSCAELILATIEKFPHEQDVCPLVTPDVITVHTELIARGSTMSSSCNENSDTVYTKKSCDDSLHLSLAGISQPGDVTISEIADAYWDSMTTGSSQFHDYIDRYLESSITYQYIHWWNDFCHQIEQQTLLIQDHLDAKHHGALIIARLAHIRERARSVSLDHEFEVHRLEIIHKRMQLQMSSCTTSSEILAVWAEWLNTLGATRSYLAQFEKPAEKPSERSVLVHSYRNGNADACMSVQFQTKDLLPLSLKDELEKGLLIMCPVHAGDKLFGFLLLDPSGLDNLDLESMSNSIGNAMRSQHLIQTLKEQASSLQNANQELYKLAQYDVLTGLPNRLNFQNQIANQCRLALTEGSRFALLFIDLDGFKHINDTLGHDAGDRLLQAVALRLEDLVDSLDLTGVFIARLGGDEFTVIVALDELKIELAYFIERVQGVLYSSFELENQILKISASTGCAIFPDHGTDAETLVKHADTAMYHAKSQGKNCIAFFNSEMGAEDRIFLRLDQEMRLGMQNHEFRLFFQPKIDLNTGNICGVEALMRWQVDSPDGLKMHSMPNEFIPVAESTGFIAQLDLFGLEQACQVAHRWELNGQKISVAVNLSVLLLQKDNFVELVSDVLNRSQLSSNLLEFEITESAVMMQVEANIEKLNALQNRGIKISIDDFRYWLFILSYLKKLPINSLKIDRSFISELESHDNQDSVDVAIVQSVVALGKALGLIVIAEGVETKSQMEMIHRIGCEQAQGYLFC